MNWNAIRYTIVTPLIAILLPLAATWVMSFFGCSGDNPATPDVVEVTSCTGGSLVSIPVLFQVVVGGIVATVLAAIKGFTGTGTVAQNILSPSVPVVSEAAAGPGTVTVAQVNAP